MDFQSMREAISHVRDMSEEATVEIGDCEVWRGDDGSVVIDVDGIVPNNEDYEGYKLVGLVREVLY